MVENKGLNAEQRKFAEDNHNLIYSFLYDRGLNVEEYYGVAAYAFVKAVKSFKPDRGIYFSTYAYICMQNEIYMEYRKIAKQNKLNIVSYDNEIEYLEGMTLLDSIIGDEDMEQNTIETLSIAEGLTRLYTNELQILKYRLDGLKHREIATKMGISQPNVSRILSKEVKFILNNKQISTRRKNILAAIDDAEASIRNNLYAEILNAISTGDVSIDAALNSNRGGHKNEESINETKKVKKDKYDKAKEEVEKLYKEDEERKEKARKQREETQARLAELRKSKAEKAKENKEKIETENKIESKQPKICIYAGDFDPVTIADIDIIYRASKMFDEVVVLVSTASESCAIPLEKRLELVKTACYYIKNIKFDIQRGLVEEYAAVNNIRVLIKVIDKHTNLDELIESVNLSNLINSELDVITMQTNNTLQGINSKTAKEVAMRGGNISNFIPFEVEKEVSNLLQKKKI